jgi:pyridoxamine 5'-phosphate oxidase
MNQDLIPERTDYGSRSLGREDLTDEPLALFEAWLAEAVAEGVPEANAVCLCTLGVDGFPDGRMVLLKGVGEGGLYFYTNYESRKGLQLEACGRASMVFWWEPLKRQVRFAGRVERAAAEVSDEYFSTRPRDSQLGAWASLQSRPLSERSVLEQRLEKLDASYPDKVPRPDYWGGFHLKPKRVEFWQGRSNRLHDRFSYDLTEDGLWAVRRLMP